MFLRYVQFFKNFISNIFQIFKIKKKKFFDVKSHRRDNCLGSTYHNNIIVTLGWYIGRDVSWARYFEISIQLLYSLNFLNFKVCK